MNVLLSKYLKQEPDWSGEEENGSVKESISRFLFLSLMRLKHP